MTDSEQDELADLDAGRRRFLKIATAGLAAGALGVLFSDKILEIVGATSLDARALSGTDAQWVMLIDLAKCDGCRQCTVGCRDAHFVPQGQEWITVFKVQDELGAEYYLPRPCMQCENPPCLKVCPVGATFRRDDGVILIDHGRCIGCRYCMAACPYDARSFNWAEPPHTEAELAHEYSPEAPWPHRIGTVEKCMFCAHETAKGELPACVTGCPMKAIYFGDRREDAISNGEEILRLAETLRREHGFRLKEEMGTEPRVWYLPARRD